MAVSDGDLLALALSAIQSGTNATINPYRLKEAIERHLVEVADLTERNNRLVSEAGAYDDLLAEMRQRAEAAEAALAAAQKRVGELQTALEEIASNTSSLGDALDTACNALQRKRVAIAGKEPDELEKQQVTQHQRSEQ